MRYYRNLLPIFIALVAVQSTSLAQPAEPSDTQTSYESAVWARLAVVTSGFTADQAAASANASSPNLVLADAEVKASIARTQQTLSRYVPNLSLQASATRNSAIEYNFGGAGASVGALNEGLLHVGTCPAGAGTDCIVDSQGQPVGAFAAQPFDVPRNTYSVDATLSVPFSDYVLALSPARKGARADESAARLRKEAEVSTVETNARIAYYDWLRAEAQLAIAEASLASSQAREEDARIGVEAGTVTGADALGLQSLAASARLAVLQAQSFLRLAEQNLRSTAQYDGPLQIGEDLTAEPADMLSLGELDALIKRGQSNRSEILALDQAIRASEFASKGISASLYPRVDGIAKVTHANPNQGFFPPTAEWNTSWLVGVNLTWRLDGYLNTRAQVREVDANTVVMRAQRDTLVRAIELEVRSAWEEWQRAKATADIAAIEFQAAEAMHEQRVLLFQGGEATSTEVVEAEIQRANATFRKISASIDKRVALARMHRAAALDAKTGSN